jgi:hypothetical protein
MKALTLNRVLKLLVQALVCSGIFVGLACVVPERTRSASTHCLSYLKQIDAAKANWALESRKTDEDVPQWTDLVGNDKYMPEMPRCPQGGAYTIGKVRERPRCSVPEHKLQ